VPGLGARVPCLVPRARFGRRGRLLQFAKGLEQCLSVHVIERVAAFGDAGDCRLKRRDGLISPAGCRRPITFSATPRDRRESRARSTLPLPPAPSCEMTWYGSDRCASGDTHWESGDYNARGGGTGAR
jgi:hypothetical protein